MKRGQSTHVQAVLNFGRRLVAVFAAAAVATTSWTAHAYQIPTSPSGSWTGSGITSGNVTFGTGTLPVESGTYSKSTPSGLTMSITVDGTFPPGSGSFFNDQNADSPNTNVTGLNPNGAGNSPGAFTTTPVMPAGANPIEMVTSVFTCKTTVPTSTTCSGIGNVRIRFTDPLGGAVPVLQPKIHLTRLGGTVGAMELGTGLSTSAGTFSATSAATVTLAVRAGGNEFYGNPTPVGNTLNVNCGVSATTTAGCGSVQVNGSVSAMNLTVNAYRTTGGANAWGDGADAYYLSMSFDEDFGGAPTTYESGGTAASHLLTDLRLGSTVTAENSTTAAHANGGATGAGLLTASPLAAAAGAAPGDTQDALTAFPTLHTGLIGQTYSVTPAISGASRAGELCGWVDFNRDNVFTAAEGVCSAFAAGATSVPLNWTVPSQTTAGPTYARLRVTYDTNISTSSVNGLFSSGEVEDYQVHIKPAVQVVKNLVPAADSGTFNLTVNGTAFASGVGHNGSTNFRTVYHLDTPDVTVATNVTTAPISNVTISETAAGSSNLADYITASSCVDGTGAAVGLGGTALAPTFTIPQSVTGAGANGRAQTISCILRNTRKPRVSVQKITVGGSGGPFTFVQSNLVSTPASISTTAPNTATPASPGTINVVTPATDVGITESFGLSWVSGGVVCSDSNSGVTGNSNPVASSATSAVTIPGARVVAGSNINCIFTNTVAAPQLTVSKSASVPTVSAAGTAVSYTIAVTNTGNTALSAIGVSDPLGAVICPSSGAATITALATGASENCTVSYVVPQSAFDTNGGGDGDIDNTATTTASYNGSPVIGSGSATVGLTISPSLSVAKVANTAGPANAGNTIGYTYRVTNTGNVTVNNVTISDAHIGYGTDPVPGNESLFNDVAPLGDSTDSGINASWNSLAPGDTVQFTSSYNVVQADIDNLQ